MILLFTITFSLAFIIYFVRILIKSKSIKLFPIINIQIILTNGIGIPFVKYFNTSYNFPDNQSIQEIALANTVIFMFVCLFFQLTVNFLYKKRIYEKKVYFNVIPRVNYVIYYFLLSIAIFGFVRFVFISNALQYIGVVFSASDHREYYHLRTTLAYLIVRLPGSGLATICVSYLNFLLSCVALFVLVKSNSFLVKLLNFVIILFLLASTLIISAILGRRSPIILLILFVVFLVVFFLSERKLRFKEISFGNNSKRYSNYKFLLSIFFPSFIAVGLASLFLSNFTATELTNSFISGLATLLERSIIIPVGTNNYYYSLFPDMMPFKGILYSLDPFDTDFFADIAKYSTGYRFNANSYFITVAYVGSGFLGVFLISVVYCLICLYQDFLISKIGNSNLSKFFLLINISGMILLSSTSLFSSILFGFFMPTLLLFSCFKKFRQVSKTYIS